MTSAITQLMIDVSSALRASLAAERAGVSLSENMRDALMRQVVGDGNPGGLG